MSEKDLTPRTLAIIITVAALTLAACNNSDSNTSKLANTATESPSCTFAVYPSLSGSITEAARQLVEHDDLG
ncbi:MAG: hypothetical protein ACFNLH_10415 [Corynebacterium matruchotii]